MQLARPRTGTNFYESFSDLIFCALVLFVALVMVLAANVGVQVDSLQDTESRLAATQAEVDSSRQQLQSIVDTHRYTGASSQPSMMVAIDVRPKSPKVYFVPIEHFDLFATSVINETPEQAIERQRTALLQVTKCIERQRGFSLEEFAQIVRSFSYYSLGRRAYPDLGFTALESGQSVVIDRVYPFSGLPSSSRGSRLISVSGVNVRDIASLNEILLNIPPEQKTVQLGIDENGAISDREANLILDSLQCILLKTQATFHALASGWRLAESGLDLLPPAPSLFSLRGQEPPSFEQVCFEGNQVVSSFKDLDFGVSDIQEPMPTLRLGISLEENRHRVLLGTFPMRVKDAVLMLQSIANGNLAIQFVDESGQPLPAIPSWVETDLLNPSGFINRTPDLIELKKWLDETAQRSSEPIEAESDDEELSPQPAQ